MQCQPNGNTHAVTPRNNSPKSESRRTQSRQLNFGCGGAYNIAYRYIWCVGCNIFKLKTRKSILKYSQIHDQKIVFYYLLAGIEPRTKYIFCNITKFYTNKWNNEIYQNFQRVQRVQRVCRRPNKNQFTAEWRSRGSSCNFEFSNVRIFFYAFKRVID